MKNYHNSITQYLNYRVSNVECDSAIGSNPLQKKVVLYILCLREG